MQSCRFKSCTPVQIGLRNWLSLRANPTTQESATLVAVYSHQQAADAPVHRGVGGGQDPVYRSAARKRHPIQFSSTNGYGTDDPCTVVSRKNSPKRAKRVDTPWRLKLVGMG